jgi:hypothetical protein
MAQPAAIAIESGLFRIQAEILPDRRISPTSVDNTAPFGVGSNTVEMVRTKITRATRATTQRPISVS